MIRFSFEVSGCDFADEMFTLFRVFSFGTFVMKRFISNLSPVEGEEHDPSTEVSCPDLRSLVPWEFDSIRREIRVPVILCELPLGRDGVADEEILPPNCTLVFESLLDGVLDRVIRGPVKSWGGTCKIGADRSN